MSRRWVCLDLFVGRGGFSQAFRDSDAWDVYGVDVAERFDADLHADVLDLRPDDLLDLVGGDRAAIDRFVILAGVPCTVFSPARNITEGGDDAWDGDRPASEQSRDAVALVYHTLGVIKALAPDYWFLENPVGRLRTLLGEPTGTITQCQYGRPYMKPTDLWGDHPDGFAYRSCSAGDGCHNTTGSYEPDRDQPRLGVLAESDDPADRAVLPYELSDTIRRAVEGEFGQQTLAGVADPNA